MTIRCCLLWLWLAFAVGAGEDTVRHLERPLPALTAPPLDILAAVLAQLPDQVPVLPTEHYCYWEGVSEGRPVRGNLRFANGLRERGELAFSFTSEKHSSSPHFTKADGVILTCDDAFNVRLEFQQRTIHFNLHQLPQTPPAAGQLLEDEQFVERTCDECGLQFYLIYHRTGKFFNWVLDDATLGKLQFAKLNENLLHETRTDFVFYATPQRKLLVGVKRSHVEQNTPFDGPFDQLADNYAEGSGRKRLLELAVPECLGRIDAWGNYLDTAKPQRVGLVPYLIYGELAEISAFLSQRPSSVLLERYVSRQGK